MSLADFLAVNPADDPTVDYSLAIPTSKDNGPDWIDIGTISETDSALDLRLSESLLNEMRSDLGRLTHELVLAEMASIASAACFQLGIPAGTSIDFRSDWVTCHATYGQDGHVTITDDSWLGDAV